MSRPRVVFMGTPEFAVPSLQAVASACDVALVVTRPDQPRGRGRAVGESEIAAAAGALSLRVIKSARPSESGTLAELRALEPDFFAVVAFGSILTRELLAVPKLGSINLHGSLLPAYRGASPVQQALWDGCLATGVTTLWMDEGIDTGDLILQRWEPIHAEDDAESLAKRLAMLGAPLLVESLLSAMSGGSARMPQDAKAGSYARKLTKGDGIVDWSLDVETVWNRQRAVTPWPGASTRLRGKPVLLTRTRPWHRLDAGSPPGTFLGTFGEGVGVACGSGALQVLALKPEGRGEMSGAAWARGARPTLGERFGVEVPA
ncbi:MAG TPA: methionyl-tRNA formyltransferase [Candidatus Eisenbacteria bacterium]|nr:methionyl-tRNA formyltransferase [Candidatus Eisenbacteria bacterium]